MPVRAVARKPGDLRPAAAPGDAPAPPPRGHDEERPLPAPHGFTHRPTADGRVLIAHHGRLVATLAGARAARLLASAAAASAAELQLLLARASGNFARHNKPGGRG